MGKHVLTEKPFTPYLAEARALTHLAERASAVTAISFNWRYSPGYQVAYRVVQDGMIGEILSVSKISSSRVFVKGFHKRNAKKSHDPKKVAVSTITRDEACRVDG